MDQDIPDNVESAKAERDALKTEIQQIEVQMSSRNMTDHQGRRLVEKEYFDWRTRALTAISHKRERLGYLKRWIHDHKDQYASEDLRLVQLTLIADALENLVDK